MAPRRRASPPPQTGSDTSDFSSGCYSPDEDDEEVRLDSPPPPPMQIPPQKKRKTNAAAKKKPRLPPVMHREPKDPSIMRILYPFLAGEVDALEHARGGTLLTRAFLVMDDAVASALEKKIREQKVREIQVCARKGKVAVELLKKLRALL